MSFSGSFSAQLPWLGTGDCFGSTESEKIYKQRYCQCTVLYHLRRSIDCDNNFLPGTAWFLAIC